jgi:GTPase
MIEPEKESGNIEYKRVLKNLSKNRYEELLSQLKWRVNEGNGIAYYLIGVEDDGKIFDLSNDEIKESINNLKKLSFDSNCKIDKVLKIKINKQKYFKIKIKKKSIDMKFNDKINILLLGKSGIGKTTFLSYLIKNKLSNDSRIFILNHKHELMSGKTSSFNYQYFIYNNVKYIFFDTPGDILYSKTLNRILSSLDLDSIIYFISDDWERKKLYFNYAKLLGIKWIELDLHNNNSFSINMSKPPTQDLIFKNLENRLNLINNKKKINIDIDKNFLILQTYPHNKFGWIYSGFLKNGILNLGDEIIFYNKEKKKVKIKSIHVDNILVDKINGPIIASICLDKSINITKPKYGFLSKVNYDFIKIIKIKWIYGMENLCDKINGFIDNNYLTLIKIGEENINKLEIIYLIEIANTNYNLTKKIFISDNLIGLVNCNNSWSK